jgi:hypothetical protein
LVVSLFESSPLKAEPFNNIITIKAYLYIEFSILTGRDMELWKISVLLKLQKLQKGKIAISRVKIKN